MMRSIADFLKPICPPRMREAVKALLRGGDADAYGSPSGRDALRVREEAGDAFYDTPDALSTALNQASFRLYEQCYDTAKRETSPADIDAALAEEFRREAVVTLKLPDARADELLSELRFEHDFSNHHARLDWRGNPSVSSVDDIKPAHPTDKLLNRVFELVYSAPVCRAISSCLGARFTIHNTRYFRSLPHSRAGAGPQSYHIDKCPPGMIRGLVYLTDVDESSGPFEYLLPDGSSRKVCGPKGTLLIFDANRIRHRGCPPVARKREVADLVIGALPRAHPRGVVWCGLNNWPNDPIHFSLQGASARFE